MSETEKDTIISIKTVLQFLSHYFAGLFRRIGQHHVLLLGGGLAFSIFICVVPFILILFSVLGIILEISSIKLQITSFIDTVIPYPDYAEYAKGVITSRIDEFIANKKLAGYLGGFGLIIAASTLFSNMRTILNTVFGVTTGKNPFIGKLRDLGMIIIVLVFFLISIAILPLLEVLEELAERIEFFEYFTAIQQSYFSIVTFLLIFLIFYCLYYFIPYERIGYKVVGMSALASTLLWELAQQAFGYYVANFATIVRIYGAYMMVVIVAFWIYYSSIIFILGAEIGQLYRERSEKKRPFPDEMELGNGL